MGLVARELTFYQRTEMNYSLKYLKSKEWSMGNGQCPECLGAHEGWHGHPCYMEEDSIGHGKDCSLAKAIKELGGDVLYRGEYKSDKQFEYYIDNNGIFGTRLKTENGCEKYNKYEKEFSDHFWKSVIGEILNKKYKD